MNKILLKNLATLLFYIVAGSVLVFYSADTYVIVWCLLMVLCTVTEIGRLVWVPSFAPIVKRAWGIDINVSNKSYWIGVFTHLGGFMIGGLIVLVLRYCGVL